MNIPKQTGDIFDILSKGQFICSNCSDEKISKLYDVIEDKDNYDILYDYFLAIGFILEKGDEFYYFSRIESKAELERKIETAFRWIDIVDFLKSYDNSFASGFRFTSSDILVKLNVDAVLKSKLEGLKKWTKEDVFQESVNKIIEMLCKDGFAEMENEIFKSYKVLSSFKYLEELINSINIPEEVQNEIPE
jgi:hypothetical protein